MTTSQVPETGAEQELRQAAITHLRKVRDLQAHLLAFVLVNLLLKKMHQTTNVTNG